MSRKRLYLILAVVGFAAPYYFFITFLAAHGFDARLFVRQLFASPISTLFAADLLISSVVFAIFMWRESARLSMKREWLYLVALCLVGLSFALPIFLYARASRPGSAPKGDATGRA